MIEDKVKTCWKGYSFDVINKLTDKNYLYYSKGKSVAITSEGEAFVKELMNKYFNMLLSLYIQIDENKYLDVLKIYFKRYMEIKIYHMIKEFYSTKD